MGGKRQLEIRRLFGLISLLSPFAILLFPGIGEWITTRSR